MNNLEKIQKLAMELKDKQSWIRKGLTKFLETWEELTSDIETSHKYIDVFTDSDDEDYYDEETVFALKYGSKDVYVKYIYQGTSTTYRPWSDSQYFDKSASMLLIKDFIYSLEGAFEDEVETLNGLNERYDDASSVLNDLLKALQSITK